MAALFADLTMLEWLYLALFTVGLIYALFLMVFGFGHGSGLDHGDVGDVGDMGHAGDLGDVGDMGHAGDLGDVGDMGHAGDLGDVGDMGHGGDVGDGHGHGHAHAGAGHGNLGIEGSPMPVRASPWNPLVIASFVGGLGGFGILATRLWGFLSLSSLIVAIPAGLGLAGLIYGFYVLVISQSGGSSAATWQDIRGAPGHVLTPIPEKGLGEVVYVARGARFTSAARSVDGQAIPTGTRVTVLDVEKAAVIVDVRYTED